LLPSGDKYISLGATGLASKRENGEIGISDYKISVVVDSKSTLLVEHGDLDDAMPQLIWAGDINGDGETDLLLSTSRKYSYAQLTLFYTEQGKPGYQKVVFTAYGC